MPPGTPPRPPARLPAASSRPVARGQEQVVACLDDARRAADHGFRSVLIADIGVLSAFAAARHAGLLPEDMQAKVSVMLPAANPPAARVLADLGADTINLPTDLTLPQIAAIRAAVDVPLDVYVEAPDNVGGFVRHHEIPELIRDRVAGLRQVRPAERPRRLPRRHTSRLDDDRPLARTRPPRAARDGAPRPLRLRAGDVRARRRGPRGPAPGARAGVIVRLLLWNLADSKTTLEELRPRLESTPNRTWISDEATERFGAVETWDGEPGEFPRELVDLIGKEPELAEEFNVEG